MSRVQSLIDAGFDESEAARDDLGRFSRRVRVKCSQCQALVINGMACHETGCLNVVRYWECFKCGYDVKQGETCDCCEDSGTDEDEEYSE